MASECQFRNKRHKPQAQRGQAPQHNAAKCRRLSRPTCFFAEALRQGLKFFFFLFQGMRLGCNKKYPIHVNDEYGSSYAATRGRRNRCRHACVRQR
jgi:hypothetical protein